MPSAGPPARREGFGHSPWILKGDFGEARDIVTFVHKMYAELLHDTLGFDVLEDVQLLVPMKIGPLGSEILNRLIQMTVQKRLYGVETPGWREDRKAVYYVHDRVIQTRNDYETGIMNGTIGKVVAVDREKRCVTVLFDGKEEPTPFGRGAGSLSDLQLAYALTAHKAQGAEFPCVVVVVHRSHAHMLDRNLLYTAVTRARETAILVGDRFAMETAAGRNRVQDRRTFLSVLGRKA